MADSIKGIAPRVDTHANWTALNPTLGKDSGGNSYGQIILSTGSPVGDILVWGNDQSYTVAYTAGQYYINAGQVDTEIETVTDQIYAYEVGDIVQKQKRQAISATSPFLLLGRSSKTLSATNYTDYVPYLRGVKLEYIYDDDTYDDSFTGTVSGSVLTLADNEANNAIWLALEEDQAEEATYTNWRTVTIGATDYSITNLPGTRQITLSAAPGDGVATAEFYPYRIAGSTTTARLLKNDGIVLATAGASGTIAGLRTRDQMQGWQLGATADITGARNYFSIIQVRDRANSTTATATYSDMQSLTTGQGVANMLKAVDDGTNGTPRIGTTTRERRLGVYTYVYVGTYVA